MDEETATQDPEGTAGPSESEPTVAVGSEIGDDLIEITPSTPPVDPTTETPPVERPKVWNVGAQKWVDAETGE